MTTNPQLLYAILSMDAYHQGAVGGLKDLLSQYTTEIDDTVRGAASDAALSGTVGFSAQTYTRPGETIIACRGTDDGGATTPGGFFGSLDRANG